MSTNDKARASWELWALLMFALVFFPSIAAILYLAVP